MHFAPLAVAVLMRPAEQLHTTGFIHPPDKDARVWFPQFHHLQHLQLLVADLHLTAGSHSLNESPQTC